MDVDKTWLDILPVAIPRVRRQTDPHGRSKAPRILSSREIWAGLESAKSPRRHFLAQADRNTFRRPPLRVSPVSCDFHIVSPTMFFDVLLASARCRGSPRCSLAHCETMSALSPYAGCHHVSEAVVGLEEASTCGAVTLGAAKLEAQNCGPRGIAPLGLKSPGFAGSPLLG